MVRSAILEMVVINLLVLTELLVVIGELGLVITYDQGLLRLLLLSFFLFYKSFYFLF